MNRYAANSDLATIAEDVEEDPGESYKAVMSTSAIIERGRQNARGRQ